MKAIWNGMELAESGKTVVVEGNHYFPPGSINRQYFENSTTQSTCPWKGVAGYCHIVVNGKRNEDAAWFYPEPKEAAMQIKDHVAFWKGVEIRE